MVPRKGIELKRYHIDVVEDIFMISAILPTNIPTIRSAAPEFRRLLADETSDFAFIQAVARWSRLTIPNLHLRQAVHDPHRLKAHGDNPAEQLEWVCRVYKYRPDAAVTAWRTLGAARREPGLGRFPRLFWFV